MTYFNKELLLESQDNIDLFKLHLPDPKLFLVDIIERDDIDSFEKLLNDVYMSKDHFKQYINFSSIRFTIIKDNRIITPVAYFIGKKNYNWRNHRKLTGLILRWDILKNKKVNKEYFKWLAEIYVLIFSIFK